MRKLLAAFLCACTGIGFAPFIAAPGQSAGEITSPVCGDIAVILKTIRTIESGGDYTAQAPGSTASGAYQYIDATWKHWYKTTHPGFAVPYPKARLAPPEIQDAVAAANVTDILKNHQHNVPVVPIIWYLPAALDNPALMDTVPAGNVLTPRQYQAKWTTEYESHTGPVSDAACTAPTSADGAWALPAPRDQISLAQIASPHHTYPAWDLIIDSGTPIYAITGGTVASVQHWDGNWWRDGCTTSNPPAGCNTCGNGLTIETRNGLRHTYCHNTQLLVTDGATVTPGQHIANSGDTGRSGTPHLHLELRVNDIQHCPQPLIAALYGSSPPPAPAELPTTGCST